MALSEAGRWLQQALLDHSEVQLDADTVISLVSYCDRGSPEDAQEYLTNIVGRESCEDIISGYLSRRAATGINEADNHLGGGAMQAYLKPQEDEVWSASAKKVSKPKSGPAELQQNSSSYTSKDADLSGSAKRGGRRTRKGGRGMSLAEAAEGRILISSGTPCSCQATRHKLVNNCLSCGKIVCEQEGEGPCKFCGALVLHEGSNYAGLEGFAPPLSETEAAANAFKDRLVEYDQNSAQRTTVIDDQSDYFQIDGDAWLSEEEKQLLQKRQEAIQQSEEARRRSIVVTIDLLGRKVVMAGDTDTDSEVKTSILGGTLAGEINNIPRITANPYISEAPVFVDVTPHMNIYSNGIHKNQQFSASQNLANSGRVQHDDPFVEALSANLVRHRQADASWHTPKLMKGSEKFCNEDVCFQESSQSSADISSSIFDICADEMYESPEKQKPVILSPSTLAQKQDERKTMSDSGQNSLILRPGMVLLRNWLTRNDQLEIVKICRTLGVGHGGFFRPGYNDEKKLHLWMMCLGKHWEPTTRSYEQRRSFDNAVRPAIPRMFIRLMRRALAAAQHFIQVESRESSIKSKHELLPDMEPDICLVNFYKHTGTLGMHQDRDEDPESLRKGIPVVSFSIGDSADFLYGTERDAEKAACVTLNSGDVLVFGGPSRLIFHGVQRVLPQTTPLWLQKEANLRPGRLNLTFRQFHG